jgi:DNA polymerase III subunit epsilon
MRVLDQPLAFVDIETSGSHFRSGRVIEIGIVRFEAGRKTEFQTLINPGHPLPPFITGLTGITDQDLESAPTFEQVAEDISEFLQGAIFVAHNARFDFTFLCHEFKRLDVVFRPRTLCTVRLSRMLYPTHRGHSLDRLIARFNFEPDGRHRALADAQVVWEFMQRATKEFGQGFVDEAAAKLLQKQSLPAGVSAQLVDALPHAPGVYIFEDGEGQPLYVGKSVDIRSRVMSHFTADAQAVKELRLAQTVKHISYVETAGELGALLLENAMIKRLQPLHNHRQRRLDCLVVVTGRPNQSGYMELEMSRVKPHEVLQAKKLYAIFRSEKRAKQALADLSKQQKLCHKLLGLENGQGACFGYQLSYCRGACIQKERPEIYRLRLEAAFAGQGVDEWPYQGATLITEQDSRRQVWEAFVVDRWRVMMHLRRDEYGNTSSASEAAGFDLDTYKLIKRFLMNPKNRHMIKPIKPQEVEALMVI